MADPKNPVQKLKDFAEDKEQQLELISVAVRLTCTVWAGFIVTLNYISIEGFASEPRDITFPASLLTASLSSFGLDASRKMKGKNHEDPLTFKQAKELLRNTAVVRIDTELDVKGATVDKAAVPPDGASK